MDNWRFPLYSGFAMPIFLVVSLAQKQPLNAAIEAKIPAPKRHKLQADGGWLIQYEGTTTELSNFIGITGQPKGESSPTGSAIVTHISSYFGRGPTEMWEWLKTRFEQQ